MTFLYILADRRPVPCPSMLEWAQWMFENEHHVGYTHIGTVRVSTVFIGIDAGLPGRGPPLLFETMIFDDYGAGRSERCCTWEQAEAQHAAAVAIATEQARKADAMLARVVAEPPASGPSG